MGRIKPPRFDYLPDKEKGAIKVKTITMKEAWEIAKKEYDIEVTVQTVHLWVSKKHLGFQPSGPGGHWRVFEDKFRQHISGIKEYFKEV